MPDAVFADPRLARVYDPLDADRSDLDVYVAIVGASGAGSVLDVGCGTGTFACLLATSGVEVVAVDPAAASLDVARSKPGADLVRWILGDATTLPDLQVDLATMTGNVAQVFLTDEAWLETLGGVRRALRPGGQLVFEVRDPARRAWLTWTRDETWARTVVEGVGAVVSWVDLRGVDGQLVSFRSTYAFERTGETLTSTSTLRFRERHEIESSLEASGLRTFEVRGAPDRPGLEHVFIAERTD